MTSPTLTKSRTDTRGPELRRRSGRRHSTLKHVALLIGSIAMLYPVLWMLKSSITPESDIMTSFSIIPTSITWENYRIGWASGVGGGIPVYIVNSLIVVIGCVIGNLVSCSLAAYAFARLDFKFKNVAFALMLAGIMLPYHVVAIPQYVEFASVGLVGTYWPLILPKILATDSFFVFLMVQFLRGVPRELDEAAAIDGAGVFRTFFSIILPLMRPALITTTIFTFIWNWNDFFSPLIYLTDPAQYTLPLGLNSLVSTESGSGLGPLLAMSVLSLIPIALFFFFTQKYIVQGIATTGIK
ncbi:carbohydrate ABC transporter permease [Kineococcus radiotolerans]|uniref:Binding-protein-dependent transport systems inner membrane component n=1 Tax=Kineococcus radiotolerans (strain ATCC BAA-149 / DSM 14245 / SRS30216) TaxID=266940 RepID=A6WA73_KINRD|nr:carbohydrate ABC transporter permease [Kineococcus radiotolerans]ABS03712.1 binding-protein-dependent transport systems inner membrane component [Kineococcus radiotolerans SRS30216 = ATCC BAA-149]